MATINELPSAADLCQAVYSNLQVGAISYRQLLDKANSDPNMTELQAQDIASRYEVVKVFSDTNTGTNTGAYAAIFKDKLTGQRILAIRGTDGTSDWLNANLHLAIGIPPALNPQFNALRSIIAQWIQSGDLPAGSNIAGHSLGGYLAAALKADSPSTFNSTFTFNAPGIAAPLGPLPAVLQLIFGMPVSQAGVVDVRGSAGLSLIAGLGNHLGSLNPVDIESAGDGDPDNHSISRLAQSLAVLRQFQISGSPPKYDLDEANHRIVVGADPGHAIRRDNSFVSDASRITRLASNARAFVCAA